MPIKYIPFQQAEEIELIAKWGDITGVLTNQSDLANALASKSDFSHNHEMEYETKNPAIGAHLDDSGNPHNISKYDINLSNVDNLKQLNRMPGDFRSFTSKSVINENDILLIEDSEDNDSKKASEPIYLYLPLKMLG